MNSIGVLLLVDLQRDFLARPGLEPHAEMVVSEAARWLQHWRATGRPVAHVRMRVNRLEDRRMAHWKNTGTWICEEGTPGERPPELLTEQAGEPVFYKNGYLPSEPSVVAAWVRASGTERVVIGGTMAHACVAQLAVALVSEGLEVFLAGGALGSDRPQVAAAVLSHLAEKGVREQALGGFDEIVESGSAVNDTVLSARAVLGTPVRPWMELRVALLAWADALAEAESELGREITKAVGKPITMARAEVRYAAASVREVVRWRDEFQETRLVADGMAARRPLGVVGVLTPWNNPVSIAVGRLAPALAYGNVVVWKPAPAVEAVSRQILDIAKQAGVPVDRLQFCPGGAETGRRLVWHAGVDAITFSGSLARGRFVLAAATERMIPCQLEMGGNNAALVDAGSDAIAAADAVLAGAFGFAGQRCTANRRVILLPAVSNVFLGRVHQRLGEWTPMDPMGVECRIGPVKDVESARRIEAVIARAGAAGARITRENGMLSDSRMVAPALIEEAAENSEIVCEETFGPVLVVQLARDWDDAMRLLNAVPQGLVASLFSPSDERWERFKVEARAGVLRRNEATAGALNDLPFGGWKTSGWGVAEHAEADALFFTRHQAWVQTNGG